jgi:hypothetical protein
LIAELAALGVEAVGIDVMTAKWDLLLVAR